MNPSLTPTQRFWRLLKPDKKEIRNIYIYSIFNGLIYLSLPLGVQAIINLIQGGQINTSWIILVSVVVLGVAITGILQIFQLRITENLQQKIFTRVGFEFAYRIPNIKMEALYKHYTPELMNRFFDTMSIQKGLPKILIDFSTATLYVIFGLILLSLYHPFFIIFSLVLVLLVLSIFKLTAKKGLNTSLEESKFKYKVAYWLEELARTSITFKLAGKTNLHLNNTDKAVHNYLGAREEHFKILVQQYSLMVFFKVLIATGLLAIGGILVMEQQMNIGQFVAAEIIILMIMNAVEKLVLNLETIYDVLTGLEKIGQVTDMELEKNEGINLIQECIDEGIKIDINDISFSYPSNKKNVLEHLSLNLKKGEKLMITGANDAGKSTLLHIVAGLYDIHKGSVAYNDFPKGNLNLSTLRALTGDFFSQEQLFQGTVFENITMGLENVTLLDVQQTVENLLLSDFIKSLPNGYDTILDPQGKKLPISTAQKLLLARSIVHKPKLLLLEDTFKHIDEYERRKIIDFLTNKENKWTLIVVSDDNYFAQKSDKVAFMKNGKIVQTGSYQTMKNVVKLNCQ